MPTYEYRCQSCRKRVALYQTYQEYGQVPVRCPHCGSEELQRLIGRVRFARSDESRMESLSDSGEWGGFDEEDPRSMGRMMRKMGQELGEELPPEFDEVVDRLEAGENPEDIEKTLPDLGGGGEDFSDLD
jgi:putative FmdB family regulatory protein